MHFLTSHYIWIAIFQLSQQENTILETMCISQSITILEKILSYILIGDVLDKTHVMDFLLYLPRDSSLGGWLQELHIIYMNQARKSRIYEIDENHL